MLNTDIMKKIIVVLSIASALAIVSCNGGNTESNNPAADTMAVGKPGQDVAGNGPLFSSDDASLQEAVRLVSSNDCATCHRVNEKSIGPAFKQVADKYENNEAMVDELAAKIVKGGSGRWGEVMMPPHQNVTIPEAREMSRYVLSLKTK